MNDTIIMFQVADYILLDRIRDIAKEFNISVDVLLNIAAKRFVADIDLVRKMRNGDAVDKISFLHFPNN